jgi:hypothetical protein
MESKPLNNEQRPDEEQGSEWEQVSETEFSPFEKAAESTEDDDTAEPEHPKESDYVKSTRHAAENAKRLGLSLEVFQSLSLRDRTALSFLDVPKNYVPPEEDAIQGKDGWLTFMDTGANYGGDTIPYTAEIQAQIHENYLQQCLQSPDFGKKLIKENQAWQEQLVIDDQKDLVTKASAVFRNILHSKYINPNELAHVSGLSQEEFLELLSIEDRISTTATTTEFLESADIEFDSERTLNWHLENAEYYEKGYIDTISKAEYDSLGEISRQHTLKMRSIKRVYDAYTDKKTKLSYRPLKYNRVHPFRVNIAYYSEQRGKTFHGKRKLPLELDQRYETPKTSLAEAIDSIALYCERHQKDLKLGSINLESGKITPEQVQEFIDNNAVIINEFYDVHSSAYRKQRKGLEKFSTAVSMRRTYLDDKNFEQALQESPQYEQLLRGIYHEARYLDIINILYRNTTPEYIEEIRDASDTQDKADRYIEEFNLILKHASQARVPLKGETSRISEAEKVLEAEFGITDKIGENAEKIIAENHSKFRTALYEGIDFQRQFKAIRSKYISQYDARNTLSRRLLRTDTEQNNNEYLSKLEHLSRFAASVRRLKQSIRSEIFKSYEAEFSQHIPEKKRQRSKTDAPIPEIDIVRNTLDLPFDLVSLDLPDREQLIQNLEEQVQKYNISSNPREYVENLIASEKRACELKLKLAFAAKTEQKRESLKRRERDNTFSEDQDEYYQHLHATEAAKLWVENYAKQGIFEDKTLKIAKLLGYEGEVSSILFTPGYMIAYDVGGHSKIQAINAEEIAKSREPEMQKLVPFIKKPPFRSDDEIPTARQVLNHRLEIEILKNEAVGANALEKRIINLQEKTGVRFPQTGIEPNTGTLHPEATEAEINGFETIYPFFGKFIAKAERSLGYSSSPEALIDSLQKIQKEYICGDSRGATHCIFQNNIDGRGVSLSNLANLLRAKSINSAKALELLAYDAAICDMESMTESEVAQFQKIARDKLSIDARTFMLLYQKTITNPIELRKCAIRLGYCREFAKYCAGGASSPELKAFFDERAKKAKGN